MPHLIENLKNKNFFFLWLAQIISQFGDRINRMALIALIAYRAPGSALGLAKVLSFTIAPVFIIGPLAGVYVDRWDRRTTLFICDFLRGLLVLTIPFVFMKQASMVPIYLVVFLVFSLSRFYVPAKLSIIPDLVEPKNLLMANSLATTTGMIASALGFGFGGILCEMIGAKGGFILNGITFFCAGSLVFSIAQKKKIVVHTNELLHTGKEMITTLKKSVFTEVKEGISYLTGHPDIRFIATIQFVLFSAVGAVYVVMIIFIQQAFGSIVKDLSLLAVAMGSGLLIGSLMYGKWGMGLSKFRTIFLCLILGGLEVVLFATVIEQYPSFLLALLIAMISGVVVAPIFIAANTVIHEVSENQMMGKVFSSLEIIMHLGFMLTMFASSFVAERVSPYLILIVVGTIISLVGLIGMFTYKRELHLNNGGM